MTLEKARFHKKAFRFNLGVGCACIDCMGSTRRRRLMVKTILKEVEVSAGWAG
jgi:hypothetical protein